MTKKQPYEKYEEFRKEKIDFLFLFRFVQIDDPATVRHGDELQLSLMANIDSIVEIVY